MTSQFRKTAVGAFLLGGLALLALGVILLGGGRLLDSDLEYVIFFDGSVSGLSIGAPVVFRGVPMGNVTRINLVANSRDSNVTIPVYVHIDEERFVHAHGGGPSEAFQQELIRRMVQRGLRARLQMSSLITGQFRVELDFYPDTAARFRSNTPDMEIPTIPSPIDTLQSTISKLPLEQMVRSLDLILTNLSGGLGDNRLARALDAFTATFEKAHALLEDTLVPQSGRLMQGFGAAGEAVGRELPAAMAAFRDAMRDIGAAAARLRAVAADAHGLVGRDSAPMNELRRLLKECTDAARALRSLAHTLERNPEALLKGRQGSR